MRACKRTSYRGRAVRCKSSRHRTSPRSCGLSASIPAAVERRQPELSQTGACSEFIVLEKIAAVTHATPHRRPMTGSG